MSVPVRLKATPEPGADAEDCFEVVRRKTQTAGGEVVLGWLIAELPGILLEAMFHAVWRAPDGSLRDISPQTGLGNDRLFLPDPQRTYDGRQVNSIRKALRDDPAVHRFIRANDRFFELTNAGERATQLGELEIPKEEAAPVLREMMEATLQLFGPKDENVQSSGRPGRNDPCPCGSGRKYKKCCGG